MHHPHDDIAIRYHLLDAGGVDLANQPEAHSIQWLIMQAYTEVMQKARMASVSLWKKLFTRIQYQSLYPAVEPYDKGALNVSLLLFMLSGRELE